MSQFSGIVARVKGKIAYGIGLFGQLFIGTPGNGIAGALAAETNYFGIFANAGTPTSGGLGSFAGSAPPGSLLVDTINRALFQNNGSLSLPAWAQIAGSNSGVSLASAVDGITAHAGGGQANATQLVAQINRVSTVASAANSVKLPLSIAGMEVTAVNDGANAMQVFGAGLDTINDAADTTGVSVAAGKAATFCCSTAGKWYMQLSA